jgi:hypothetical protein
MLSHTGRDKSEKGFFYSLNAWAEGAPRSETTRVPNSGTMLGAPLEPMVGRLLAKHDLRTGCVAVERCALVRNPLQREVAPSKIEREERISHMEHLVSVVELEDWRGALVTGCDRRHMLEYTRDFMKLGNLSR